MTEATGNAAVRVDRARRLVAARREAVWRALADPGLYAAWIAPGDMTARVEAYDLREGGAYRVVLSYARGGTGKTTAGSDVAEGRFVEVSPPARLVQTVRFDSPDPAFAGEMRVAWTLAEVAGGTEVTVEATDVPPGITAEDHAAGLSASLGNLARLVEGGLSRR
jgi:uncharacterized protein YndB with AHSA1/START domain